MDRSMHSKMRKGEIKKKLKEKLQVSQYLSVQFTKCNLQEKIKTTVKSMNVLAIYR